MNDFLIASKFAYRTMVLVTYAKTRPNLAFMLLWNAGYRGRELDLTK